MNLLVLCSERELLTRLAAKLPANWSISHQDSSVPGAVQRLRVDAQTLLLLDFHGTQAAASVELVRQLRQHRPELPLVAVGSTSLSQVDGVVAAVRAGLRDFVDLDADNPEVQSVLQRAAVPVPAQAPDSARRAPLILLLGVRVGMGTSTLAAHLAVLLQRTQRTGPGQDVLLLDLAQPAGDLALYLNADSQFHYDEALRSAGRIDATLARTALARHSSGLALLDRSSAAEALPTGDPAVLLQRLRGLFSSVLCDLGGSPLRQVHPGLLEAADAIWLVTDTAIASLVSLDNVLRQLPPAVREREGVVQLVVNRAHEEDGLTAAQIAGRFDLPLLTALPERSTLRASASHGRLLLEDAPRDHLRALAPLLAHFDPSASPPEAQGLRDRLANALSSLQWKTK